MVVELGPVELDIIPVLVLFIDDGLSVELGAGIGATVVASSEKLLELRSEDEPRFSSELVT